MERKVFLLFMKQVKPWAIFTPSWLPRSNIPRKISPSYFSLDYSNLPYPPQVVHFYTILLHLSAWANQMVNTKGLFMVLERNYLYKDRNSPSSSCKWIAPKKYSTDFCFTQTIHCCAFSPNIQGSTFCLRNKLDLGESLVGDSKVRHL